jgi:hypothetical protein
MKSLKLNFEVQMLLQCHYNTLLLVGRGEKRKKNKKKKKKMDRETNSKQDANKQ